MTPTTCCHERVQTEYIRGRRRSCVPEYVMRTEDVCAPAPHMSNAARQERPAQRGLRPLNVRASRGLATCSPGTGARRGAQTSQSLNGRRSLVRAWQQFPKANMFKSQRLISSPLPAKPRRGFATRRSSCRWLGCGARL